MFVIVETLMLLIPATARKHNLKVVPQFELDSRKQPDLYSAGGIAYLSHRFDRFLDQLMRK